MCVDKGRGARESHVLTTNCIGTVKFFYIAHLRSAG